MLHSVITGRSSVSNQQTRGSPYFARIFPGRVEIQYSSQARRKRTSNAFGLPLVDSVAPTEYSPHGGNRCKHANKSECRTHCFTLLCCKLLGKEKRYPRAEHGARGDGKGELWEAEMRFFHKQMIDALAMRVNSAAK
jgi:hypothetical protein